MYSLFSCFAWIHAATLPAAHQTRHSLTGRNNKRQSFRPQVMAKETGKRTSAPENEKQTLSFSAGPHSRRAKASDIVMMRPREECNGASTPTVIGISPSSLDTLTTTYIHSAELGTDASRFAFLIYRLTG